MNSSLSLIVASTTTTSATATATATITNGNGLETYITPFDETEIIVSAAIIFTFLVVGLIGNGLTLAVIVSYKKLRDNTFMRFLLSLCVSDLLSALISWLFLYRRTWGFDEWNLPPFFCKFYWAADIMTSFVTAIHVLAFSALRFLSIRHPFQYKKITLFHANACIGIIWGICYVSGFSPYMVIFGAQERDRYGDAPDARWPACTTLPNWLFLFFNFIVIQKRLSNFKYLRTIT
ncbi:motilin receptor-like [Clavelina lepadiformis]|uniref:motilin receptor-like n=1 Tax=Clavelina lepadiformis TaxID=159417 RepID=UPI004043126C